MARVSTYIYSDLSGYLNFQHLNGMENCAGGRNSQVHTRAPVRARNCECKPVNAKLYLQDRDAIIIISVIA